MWSFYGGDHKGIVNEIDFAGFENDYREVVYLPILVNTISQRLIS
jgi:hypothetical protein